MLLTRHHDQKSIRDVIHNILALWVRFPFVTLATVVGVFAAVILIDTPGGRPPDWLVKLLLISILACPALTAVTFVAERLKARYNSTMAIQLVGIAALAFYYWVLPASVDDWQTQTVYRFILANIAAVIAVLVAWWVGRQESKTVWQFWNALAVRFLTTAFFAAVVFIGLCAAIGLMDYLFGLDLPRSIYPQVWVMVVGIFGAWFFLSGVPNESDSYESSVLPKSSIFLVQFILFPILALFMVILYVYTGKILFTWEWPLGGVAWWVITVSVWGIISYLAVYPLLSEEKYAWLRKTFAVFFAALLPLVIVLFLSIWIRIREYGLTENRYLVVVIGLWFAGIALYLLLAKQKRIEYLPVSLGVLFLLSAFGPWSAFSLSLKSQVYRLERFLTEQKMLSNGVIQVGMPCTDSHCVLDGKKITEVSSMVRYIVQHNGVQYIQPWFPENLLQDRMDTNGGSSDIAINALEQLDLYKSRQASAVVSAPTVTAPTVFGIRNTEIFSISNFDYLADTILEPNEKFISIPQAALLVKMENNHIRISRSRDRQLLLDLSVVDFLNNLKQKYNLSTANYIPVEDMTIEGQTELIRIKFIATEVAMTYDQDVVDAKHIIGKLLVSLRE